MKIECAHDELIELHKLIPNPKNPNKHPKKQIEMLAKIIDYQGQRAPIVVSRRSGFITKGHGRLEAIQSLGWEKAAVDFQEYESEAQEHADMIADNKIAELAESDSILINELALTMPEDFNFELLGIPDFKPIETNVLNEELEDEVPETPKETRIKLGDVIELGNHRLMCGDSTSIDAVEKLMNGEKADMVFTDPPYGISYKSNWSKRFDEIKNDDEFLDFKPILEVVCATDCPIYIWTSHQVFHIWRELFLEDYKSTIIWYKKFGGMGDLSAEYGHNYEMCLYLCKGRSNFVGDRPKAVWEISSDNPERYNHPTQKPVALAEYAIGHHNKKYILDLFGGSGSTLIACEKTNRKCFMMELDPHYCDVIVTRWCKYTNQTKVKLNGQEIDWKIDG